jgi:hypothetical protein
MNTETVTITPTFGLDSDGNPVDAGDPVQAQALVAPGNTAFQYGATSDTDTTDFTLYLPIDTEVKDDDLIEVRGRTCTARVREWHSMRTTRAKLEVLCRSTTGAS